jgi:hypothetical protein
MHLPLEAKLDPTTRLGALSVQWLKYIQIEHAGFDLMYGQVSFESLGIMIP